MKRSTYWMLSKVMIPPCGLFHRPFQLAVPVSMAVRTLPMNLGSVTVILRYGCFWLPWKPQRFSRMTMRTSKMHGVCEAIWESR